MKIIGSMDFVLKNTAVCIGKFDGIHKGHRLLLEEAGKAGLTTVMFTFLMDRTNVIYAEMEKIQLAERLGVDVFVEIPFDDHFMRQSAEEFVTEVLVERCGARKVIVGEDFCFGYKRSGTVPLLTRMGEKYGFETIVKEKMIAHGDVISSTRIRSLLRSGMIEEADNLLQTPYFIAGTVEKGNQLGRTINTPTANLYPDKVKELPPFGVYAVLVEAEGKQYRGVANLGKKPTIAGDNPVGLEVWLFDFDGYLYGKKITVYFIRFQRREQKFPSLDELKHQIANDAEAARQTLAELEDGYLRQSFYC